MYLYTYWATIGVASEQLTSYFRAFKSYEKRNRRMAEVKERQGSEYVEQGSPKYMTVALT